MGPNLNGCVKERVVLFASSSIGIGELECESASSHLDPSTRIFSIQVGPYLILSTQYFEAVFDDNQTFIYKLHINNPLHSDSQAHLVRYTSALRERKCSVWCHIQVMSRLSFQVDTAIDEVCMCSPYRLSFHNILIGIDLIYIRLILLRHHFFRPGLDSLSTMTMKA